MYIAVLITGRITSDSLDRSVDYMNSIRTHASPNHVVFFFSLNPTITDKTYLEKYCAKLNVTPEDSVTLHAYTPPSIIYNFPKNQYTSVERSWSMFSHNFGAFKKMEEYETKHNIQFDIVVKFRSDTRGNQPFLINPTTPHTLYIPEMYDHTGLNDQIAYGDRNSMKLYCECIHNIISLCEKGCIYHPETLLLAHVKSKNLKIKRFSYEYKIFR